ncbi:YaaL family protein [Oceanobacillus sp. Castelsardo]|uniref:YaaL family protein n=1 Tax=Oceanobacillus sp. Castelsardo TaxID=1851204 RepID=UPI00083988AA|nr:YaaL family protein [Oceanobacillus sp. Castelsardo]
MGKKIKKKDVDAELLHSIYQLESEWKQIRSIMEHSVEASQIGRLQESLAQAKYIFLLKEARHRNLHALKLK